MTHNPKNKDYYKALIEKNPEYEELFYVGVKTTGVFCRPTCPAREPKFGNCEFFVTAKEALLASFRPCLRCKPLCVPNELRPTVKKLIDATEGNPQKPWTNADLASGYESNSGFRDAFTKIIGAPSSRTDVSPLKASWLATQLGPMMVIANDSEIYLLEFVNRHGLEKEIERLRVKFKIGVIPGTSAAIDRISKELIDYFQGKSAHFTTPIHLIGTPFQKKVWEALKKIPPGETRSYAEIAKAIGKPSSYRAVAQANGANQLALILPCHRVINTNGEIGGYSGGISRKQWLLEHEKIFRG